MILYIRGEIVEKEKRKTKTSTTVKNRYNKRTYREYRFTVRRDSPLNDAIEKFKEENPNELSNLIKVLLSEHFEAENTRRR